MKRDLAELQHKIASANGGDKDLDSRIASYLDDPSAEDPVPNYTGSVDACIALIGRALPHWHWHVGHGPSGILPYAALTKEVQASDAISDRVEATAPTVPLALLGALIKAKRSERRRS